jgi:hypothetical protein
MIELITRAARLQRPMVRTKPEEGSAVGIRMLFDA